MKNFNPHEHNLKLMRNIQPSMSYDGVMPLSEWRESALVKLNELLGLPFVQCEPKTEVEYRSEHDTYYETRFIFQSEEGYYVPCHFLEPKNTDSPPPVVICLQGHSKGMHISLGRPKYEGDEKSIAGGDRDFAVRALKEGCCALVIEQRNFGECGGTEKGHNCYKSAMSALLFGRTTIGERVWDVQRALDSAQGLFPSADFNRVICLGNSGGGTVTYYAACLEERIKIVVPSCSICNYETSIAPIYHCSCNFIPNIRSFFEMGDLALLIAPKPLLIVTGKDDDIFPIDAVKETYARIKSLYTISGCPDLCELIIGQSGHRFYADQAWQSIKRYL